jgi:opacity protein-like surface antigen
VKLKYGLHMKTPLKAFSLIALATMGLTSTSLASTIDHPKFYVGIEGGYSKPLKKKFKHIESGSIGNLTGSKVYEGKVGYRFHENVAVELSYAYRPDYTLKLDIPDQDLYKNMHSSGKVKSYAIMANLVYFAQSETRTTPYFLAGLGYARVTPEKATIYGDIPAYNISKKEVGNVMKHKTERIAYRLGAGVDVAMSNNLALTFGGKVEIVNNIRLNTRFINIMTGQEVERKSIKKTIGIAELTAGLKLSF